MSKSRAPVFVGANKPLEMREYELPVLGEKEALVKMRLVGICGTDVHRWHDPTTPSPMIFGHENLGTISKLGKDKNSDAVGKKSLKGTGWSLAGR